MRKSWKIQAGTLSLASLSLAIALSACGSKGSRPAPIGGMPGGVVPVPVAPVPQPGVIPPMLPGRDPRLSVSWENRVVTIGGTRELDGAVEELARDGFVVTQITRAGGDAGGLVLLASRDKSRSNVRFDFQVLRLSRYEDESFAAALKPLVSTRFAVTAAYEEGEGDDVEHVVVLMRDPEQKSEIGLRVRYVAAGSGLLESTVKGWARDGFRVTAVAKHRRGWILYGTRICDDTRAFEAEVSTIQTSKVDLCIKGMALWGFVPNAVFKGTRHTYFIIATREIGGDLGFETYASERRPDDVRDLSMRFSESGYFVPAMTITAEGEYRLVGLKARGYRGCAPATRASGSLCSGFVGGRQIGLGAIHGNGAVVTAPAAASTNGGFWFDVSVGGGAHGSAGAGGSASVGGGGTVGVGPGNRTF